MRVRSTVSLMGGKWSHSQNSRMIELGLLINQPALKNTRTFQRFLLILYIFLVLGTSAAALSKVLKLLPSSSFRLHGGDVDRNFVNNRFPKVPLYTPRFDANTRTAAQQGKCASAIKTVSGGEVKIAKTLALHIALLCMRARSLCEKWEKWTKYSHHPHLHMEY